MWSGRETGRRETGGSGLMRKELCWRRFEDHQQLCQREERCRGAPGEVARVRPALR